MQKTKENVGVQYQLSTSPYPVQGQAYKTLQLLKQIQTQNFSRSACGSTHHQQDKLII